MSDNDVAIKVTNLSKSFKLPHEKSNSVKSIIVNPFKKRTFEKQEVLKNIDFEIKKGEFFGIVGRNGSGKSTLLKLLAGIYSPNKGHIQINGKLTPFIELGVGFNQELTGRENVFLNGALLGFNRKEMTAMYDEIVEFAELEKFMDQKLKNYSSGMQVRLAFSIAIRANTDILILDEVLAVGDSNFQKKCYDYFGQIKNANKTVVLVTHDMSAVERFCDRAILINDGEIYSKGSTAEVTKKYSDINMSKQLESLDTKNRDSLTTNINNTVKVKATVIVNNKKANIVRVTDKKLSIEYTIESGIDIPNAVFGMYVINGGGTPIFATNTRIINQNLNLVKDKPVNIRIELDNIFSNGEYSVTAGIKNDNQTEIYYSNANVTKFLVGGRKHDFGLVSPELKVEISQD